MKRIAVSLLILLCTYAVLSAKGKKPLKEPIYLDIPFQQSSIEREPYRNKDLLLSDSLKQVLLFDSTMSRSFPELENLGVHIKQSKDRKFRVLSWCSKNDEYSTCFYRHLVQYYVAPNKTRCFYFDPERKWSRTEFDDIGVSQSTFIDSIHHLRNGVYILSGTAYNCHKLFAIDIGRGIIKDAYPFSNSKSKNGNVISSSISSNYMNNIYKLDGEHLQMPENDSLGYFTGNYSDSYYNGSTFDNAETYLKRLNDYKEGKCLMTKLYFKDARNARAITNVDPQSNYSLIAEVAYDYNTMLPQDDDPIIITLRNDDCNSDSIATECNVEFPLMLENGYVYIENFNMCDIPPILSNTANNDLTQVTYAAGKKVALTYEWLRYTAVAFNCERPSAEDCKLIRWALEIDGEQKLLDSERYQGYQIDLQMKEEWSGKMICVTPYIKDQEINAQATIKTKVLVD